MAITSLYLCRSNIQIKQVLNHLETERNRTELKKRELSWKNYTVLSSSNDIACFWCNAAVIMKNIVFVKNKILDNLEILKLFK